MRLSILSLMILAQIGFIGSASAANSGTGETAILCTLIVNGDSAQAKTSGPNDKTLTLAATPLASAPEMKISAIAKGGRILTVEVTNTLTGSASSTEVQLQMQDQTAQGVYTVLQEGDARSSAICYLN